MGGSEPRPSEAMMNSGKTEMPLSILALAPIFSAKIKETIWIGLPKTEKEKLVRLGKKSARSEPAFEI